MEVLALIIVIYLIYKFFNGPSKEERENKALKERLTHIKSIDKSKIICVDIETTGLNKTKDEILQISILDGNGNIVFNKYVKPRHRKRWPDAAALHGITPQMVKNQPTLDEHLKDLEEIITNAELIVGYNCEKFDLPFLSASGVRFIDGTPCYDVMIAFANVYKEWNEYYKRYNYKNLKFCAKYYGYTGKLNTHNSLDDATATLFTFNAVVDDILNSLSKPVT